jgi:flagellar motor component MotA
MDEVMRMGGKIDKMLKASYHPKAELVDLVAKLNQWAAVFRRDSMKA